MCLTRYMQSEHGHRIEILPVVNGTPVRWRQYAELASEGRVSKQDFEEHQAKYNAMEADIGLLLKRFRKFDRELLSKNSQFDAEVVFPYVNGLIQDVQELYSHPEIAVYLEEVLEEPRQCYMHQYLNEGLCCR